MEAIPKGPHDLGHHMRKLASHILGDACEIRVIDYGLDVVGRKVADQ
jgi:hypothetical protein